LQAEDPIKALQEMVLALTQERLSRPAIKEHRPRKSNPSRKTWEATHPTCTFRASLETKARLNEWKEKANLSFGDITMIGLERLEQMELVNVLKLKISQEKNSL